MKSQQKTSQFKNFNFQDNQQEFFSLKNKRFNNKKLREECLRLLEENKKLMDESKSHRGGSMMEVCSKEAVLQATNSEVIAMLIKLIQLNIDKRIQLKETKAEKLTNRCGLGKEEEIAQKMSEISLKKQNVLNDIDNSESKFNGERQLKTKAVQQIENIQFQIIEEESQISKANLQSEISNLPKVQQSQGAYETDALSLIEQQNHSFRKKHEFLKHIHEAMQKSLSEKTQELEQQRKDLVRLGELKRQVSEKEARINELKKERAYYEEVRKEKIFKAVEKVSEEVQAEWYEEKKEAEEMLMQVLGMISEKSANFGMVDVASLLKEAEAYNNQSLSDQIF